MKALVLAAGLSTRLSAVTGGGPKVLVPVGGRSLIEWNLAWLASCGVTRVWVNLHHGGDVIRAALGSGERFGLRIHYSEEPVLRGTAGGWKRLEREWTTTSLVVYGDNLMRFDLRRMQRTHIESGRWATVALFDAAAHANTGGTGGRATLTPDGSIGSFVEGAESAGLINAGVYLLEPAAAEWIGDGFQDFGHDVLPRLAEAGQLQAHVIEPEGFCLGVDTPERFARAAELLAQGVIAP